MEASIGGPDIHPVEQRGRRILARRPSRERQAARTVISLPRGDRERQNQPEQKYARPWPIRFCQRRWSHLLHVRGPGLAGEG